MTDNLPDVPFGFVMEPPFYMLCNNETPDPETGEPLLDDQIRFIAPFNQDGMQSLAVFTDRDLAETYKSHCDPQTRLKLFHLPSFGDLEKLLVRCQDNYERIAIDPNAKNRIFQTVLLQGLILYCQFRQAQTSTPEDQQS